MTFTSAEFSLFLPAVFFLNYLAGKVSVAAQNTVLIIAGIIFAATWSVLCAALLVTAVLISYTGGISLSRFSGPRRQFIILFVAVCLLLSVLIVFKYSVFIATQIALLFSLPPQALRPEAFSFLITTGLSFFILQSIGYLLDVYRETRLPEPSLLNYAAFNSFFPLISSGPIERSTTLLPQFATVRPFNYSMAVEGSKLILWGLFKKMVIAENTGLAVNDVSRNYTGYHGSTLAVAAVLYSVQIYCDFSGYTDIARGAGKTLGLNIIPNFNFPYFSQSVTEFWRRWHISLSGWLRDYCFMPLVLGFRKAGKLAVPAATILLFLISGFWHGAGFTFILWGLLHGITITTELKTLPLLSKAGKTVGMLYTFTLVTLFWIFFFSPTLNDATAYINHMFSRSLFSAPEMLLRPGYYVLVVIYFITEWFMRGSEQPFDLYRGKYATQVRWVMYYLLLLSIVLFGGVDNDFIYFRF